VGIESMFVEANLVELDFASDAAQRRPPFREEHLDHIDRLLRAGTILGAGALADLSGSIVVTAGADRAAARRLISENAYVREGIWVNIRIRPFLWFSRS